MAQQKGMEGLVKPKEEELEVVRVPNNDRERALELIKNPP